ncbi:MAG: hypothetical protein FD123_1595 [Bacteroidetes bacterium]|nr:MAG: hypothetical protein FD123_1595 [Bacteroidota bacterium]
MDTLANAKNQSEKEEVKPETSAHQNLKDKLKDDSDEWDESVIRQLQLLRHWQHDPQSGAPFIQYKKEEKKTEQEPVIPENKSEEMPVPPVTAAEEMQDILTVLIEPGEEDVVISIEESIEDTVSEEEAGNEELDYEITTLVSEEIVEQEKHIVKPEDPVTQEIFSKAIGSSIELEVSDILPTPEELQPKAKREAWTSGESEETVTDTTEEPLSDSPLSFAQWLKEVNRRALYQGMSGAEKREDEHEEQDELIDKFIQEAPRIKPQRSEFYNPVNMAKKSVTEDSELITETLARIYEKQGNIPKAIRAYQKLSLKFPEKSLYFASLIENLKKTPNKNSK